MKLLMSHRASILIQAPPASLSCVSKVAAVCPLRHGVAKACLGLGVAPLDQYDSILPGPRINEMVWLQLVKGRPYPFLCCILDSRLNPGRRCQGLGTVAGSPKDPRTSQRDAVTAAQASWVQAHVAPNPSSAPHLG